MATAVTTALSTISNPSSIITRRNHLHIRTFLTQHLSPSSTSLSSSFLLSSSNNYNNILHLLLPSSSSSSWIETNKTTTRHLHVTADATKKNKVRSTTRELTSEPRYSKAARRFYNENFREISSQRLSKVLAAAGVASRRSCEELIFDGRVTVNGSVCNTPQTKVDPKKDMIYVNGNRLPKKLPPKVYLALNKPKGYICSCGENETKSVVSLFNDYMKNWDKRNPGQPKPRLFTVGRLDVATTGLIIVTNDGEFAQKISHPSSGLSKEYIATIDGTVHKKHLIAISEGTVIDGVHCTPDAVELLPQQPDKSRARLRIVVHEGRNHEVRELVKSAGLQIYSLKRIRMLELNLLYDEQITVFFLALRSLQTSLRSTDALIPIVGIKLAI